MGRGSVFGQDVGGFIVLHPHQQMGIPPLHEPDVEGAQGFLSRSLCQAATRMMTVRAS